MNSKVKHTNKSRLYCRFLKSVRSQTWFRIRIDKKKRINSPIWDRKSQSKSKLKDKKDVSSKIKSNERPKTSKKPIKNQNKDNWLLSESASNEKLHSKINNIAQFKRRSGITKLFDDSNVKQRKKKASVPVNLSATFKKPSKNSKYKYIL